MSIDLPNPSFRADQRQRTHFRRLSLSIIVILGVVASGLGVVNATQGPRVSNTEMNLQALISRAGQRVLVHTNQPLADVPVGDVVVSPATDAEVSVSQNTVTVTFASMLDYGTEYVVSIDTRGATTGINATLEVRFTTPDIAVYSLQRDTGQTASGEDQPDRILRKSIPNGSESESVFEAPRIQDYVTLNNLLAVVTLDEDDNPALTVASLTDGVQMPISVPGAKTIRNLHAASSGDLFGYILNAGYGNPDGPQNALYLYDFTSGSAVPKEVVGFGGEALPVMDWTFVPGTTSIVVHSEDLQLYLIDTLSDEEPTPLGQHVEMRGFIPGTVQLIVADPLTGSTIDLATGVTEAFDLPVPNLPDTLYPGKLVLLTENSYIQEYTEIKPGATSNDLTSVIVATGPDGDRELYRTTSPGTTIRDYCLSPNGEYLAVEVISSEGTPDFYPIVNGYSASSVSFVKLTDGASDRGINGFLPDWCR